MFENRSQQSKTEVNARTERSQNSSHEQTCSLLKKNLESQYSSSSRKKPVESQYSSWSRKNLYNLNTPLRVVKTKSTAI